MSGILCRFWKHDTTDKALTLILVKSTYIVTLHIQNPSKYWPPIYVSISHVVSFLGASFTHSSFSFIRKCRARPISLIRHYKNIQEKKCEAAHYVIFSLTIETARTNHTLVINIPLTCLAFQRCFRPTRPFLESIIKGPIQAQFLTKFYLCSPEVCSFLTTRIDKTHRILAISLFLKRTSRRPLRKIIC